MARTATMTKSRNKEKKWAEFKDRLSYIKDNVDSRYLLESLGFRIERETMRELRGTCVIHGGDNPTSFRFNKERKTWVCFSRKCHDIHGNDVIGLIRAVNKVEFMQAVEYLSQIVGDFSTEAALDYKKNRERQEFMDTQDKDPYIHPQVTEEKLSRFVWARSKFFNAEGFHNRTLDYFEVGGGYKKEGILKDVIPIRGTDGTLLAYSLRDVRKHVPYDIKYQITAGFDKDKVLYNLHRIIPVNKPIIVVEGFKSVWRLHDYGIKNVVAAMGSHITQGQQRLLYTHATHGVVILFDSDKAGAEGTINAYETLKGKIDVWPVFITEDGLDPADLDKETVYGYLKDYI